MSDLEALIAGPFIALLLSPLLLHYGLSWSQLVPLLCLFGMVGAQLFLSAAVRGKDLFCPLNFCALYFFAYFVARAFYVMTTPEAPRIGLQPYEDSLPAALWCACLGYLSLFFGYQSKAAQFLVKFLPRMKLRWPETAPTLRLSLLVLIGVSCSAYLFSLGQAVGVLDSFAFVDHPPPGIVVLFSNATNLGLLASCIFWFSRSRSNDDRGFMTPLILAVIGIAGQIAVSGQKEALLSPLVSCLIAFHYLKRRLQLGQLLLISVPILFLSFGVLNTYRFVIGRQVGPPKSLGDVAHRLSLAYDHFASGERDAEEESASTGLLDRQAGVDALAVVMKYTPAVEPFGYGREFFPVLAQTLIPRVLWPGKPVYTPSLSFERTYLDLPWTINGASSIHLISDLYKQLAFPGVCLGLSILGIVLRVLYLTCSPPANPVCVLYYASLLPNMIHFMEADAATFVILASRECVFLWLISHFLAAKQSRPGMSRSQSAVPYHSRVPTRV